jgi:hypothetical protein
MITNKSVVGRQEKKKPEENVASKYNLLQIAENKRNKRKEALLKAMSSYKNSDV